MKRQAKRDAARRPHRAAARGRFWTATDKLQHQINELERELRAFEAVRHELVVGSGPSNFTGLRPILEGIA